MAQPLLFITLTLLPPSNSLGSDHAGIEELLDKYVEAVETLDKELAQSIWIQSDDVTFIQPRGHQKGWEQVWNNFYLGAMGNFSERELLLKNLSIHSLGEDSAWVEFYWDFNATFRKDGKKISTQGRETQVLKKEKDGWKIVHVHYSNMPVEGEREGF